MKQSIVIEVELDENNLPESINMNTSGDKKINLEAFLFSVVQLHQLQVFFGGVFQRLSHL